MLFKKEIKEGPCVPGDDVILRHRYLSIVSRRGEDELQGFLVNHPYECEIVMCNVSPQRRDVTLLYQIPNGSLPLQRTKFINSRRVRLAAYTTER